MINLFRINQEKFANILQNNLRLAQNKSLEKLQSDLDFELSKAKNPEQKRIVIVNFLSDSDVRNSLAIIILTDPTLKFSETAKASAYEQILGVNENKLNKFLETNTDFIEKGSTLKNILVSLLSGKAKFEKPEYSKVNDEPDFERGGPRVYQPEVDNDDSKSYFVNELLKNCEELGIVISDEDKETLAQGDYSKVYWQALLSALKKIAILTLNAEQMRRVDFLLNYIEKNNVDDPKVSTNLDRLFEQYLRHQTENSIKQLKITKEEKRSIKQQGGKVLKKGKSYAEFFKQMKPDIDALDEILANLRKHVSKQNIFKSSAFFTKDIENIYESKQLVNNFIEREKSYIQELMKLFREISFHALILTEQLDELLPKTGTTLPKLIEHESRGQGAEKIHELFFVYQKLLIERIDAINKEQQEFKENLQMIANKFSSEMSPEKARKYYQTNISKDKFKHLYAVFLNSKLTGLDEAQLSSINPTTLAEEFMNILQKNFNVPEDLSLPILIQYATRAIKIKIDSLSEPLLQQPITVSEPYPSMEKYPLSPDEHENWKKRQEKQKESIEDSKQQKESSLETLIKKYASQYHSSCK